MGMNRTAGIDAASHHVAGAPFAGNQVPVPGDAAAAADDEVMRFAQKNPCVAHQTGRC